MAEQLHYAVRSYLRSSEEVRVILEATVLQSESAASGADGNGERNALNRRILVVVAHRDEEDGREQGRYVGLRSL
jgi:hypothetical protein